MLMPIDGVMIELFTTNIGCFVVASKTINCVSGYGVNLLRDNNLETYWQSDGGQPHMVNVQFRFVFHFQLNFALNRLCFSGDGSCF